MIETSDSNAARNRNPPSQRLGLTLTGAPSCQLRSLTRSTHAISYTFPYRY